MGRRKSCSCFLTIPGITPKATETRINLVALLTLKPISIILVTGYLGAGKTTLVNHLLRGPLEGRRAALIINEFAAVGVDGALVDSDRAEELYEINKGSLFCVCTKVDLLNALTDIADRVGPEVVVVEATGVAEPAEFTTLVDSPALRDRFVVRATLGVVDARNFTKIAPFLQAARRQIESADGLVVNKTDLAATVDVQTLRKLLEEMNPHAPQVETEGAAVPGAWLDAISHRDHGGQVAGEKPARLYSANFQHEGRLDRTGLEALVADLGEKLLRLKGNADFGAGPVFVELVGGDLMVHDRRTAVQLGGSGTNLSAILWDVGPDAWTARMADLVGEGAGQ